MDNIKYIVVYSPRSFTVRESDIIDRIVCNRQVFDSKDEAIKKNNMYNNFRDDGTSDVIAIDIDRGKFYNGFGSEITMNEKIIVDALEHYVGSFEKNYARLMEFGIPKEMLPEIDPNIEYTRKYMERKKNGDFGG